jgi:hypothetical protein
MVSKNYNRIFFVLGSIAPFVVQGRGGGGGQQFLRRNALQQPICNPIIDNDQRDDSSIFVILELKGVANVSDTIANSIAVNNTFVNAYDTLVSCTQEGATRSMENATILTDAVKLIQQTISITTSHRVILHG